MEDLEIYEKSRFLLNDPKYPSPEANLAWLMRQESSPDTHSILTDLSRALGVIIVPSLIIHLAKNL